MTKQTHSGLPICGNCNYTDCTPWIRWCGRYVATGKSCPSGWSRFRDGGCSLSPPVPVQLLLKVCFRAVDGCARNQSTCTSPGPLSSGRCIWECETLQQKLICLDFTLLISCFVIIKLQKQQHIIEFVLCSWDLLTWDFSRICQEGTCMWSHVTLALKIKFQSHSCHLSIAVSKLLLTPRVVKRKYFNKIFSGQQPRQVVYSPFNHLTPLLAREYFIEFSRHKT